jgi:hypothetical protein
MELLEYTPYTLVCYMFLAHFRVVYVAMPCLSGGSYCSGILELSTGISLTASRSAKLRYFVHSAAVWHVQGNAARTVAYTIVIANIVE